MPNLNKNTSRKYVPRSRPRNVVNSTGNQALYNSHAWRKAATGYRKKHPLCEVAQAVGEVRAAEVVDHIIPVSAGGAIWDKLNWMPMSHHYHNKKRGHERHGLDIDTINTPKGLLPRDKQQVIGLLTRGRGG